MILNQGHNDAKMGGLSTPKYAHGVAVGSCKGIAALAGQISILGFVFTPSIVALLRLVPYLLADALAISFGGDDGGVTKQCKNHHCGHRCSRTLSARRDVGSFAKLNSTHVIIVMSHRVSSHDQCKCVP